VLFRSGGRFLLRIEDTDRERSTPEAIATVMEALDWLGLDHDGTPVHQSSQAPRHEQAADRLLNLDLAYRNSDALPATVFRIDKALFDPSFVTDPGAAAVLDVTKAAGLRATLRSLVVIDRNEKTGEEYFRPVPWDAIEAGLMLERDDGGAVEGDRLLQAVREKCGDDVGAETSCDVHEIAEGRVARVHFRRRTVFYDDLILGRREKPLDSLRDFVIVRGDESPVFHLANVVDDVTMGVTHILRGNDHIENTFRHLFLFRALGATPPRYGHFPMIVNERGKPYSKRDGAAYVGEFRERGILPGALFNFLALCGWSPGDDREQMTRDELVAAFSLDRVNDAPAQFDLEKLEWMNGLYLKDLPADALVPLLCDAIRDAGEDPGRYDAGAWGALADLMRERIRTPREFPEKAGFFFTDAVAIDWDNKKVRKVFKKESADAALAGMRQRIADAEPWSAEGLDAAVEAFAEAEGLKLGDVAQPLRVAVTGAAASPGIGETLFFLGRDRCLARIDAARAARAERAGD